MNTTILKLYVKMLRVKDTIVRDESGQDLVEYGLVVALIALAAITGMQALATSIGNAFTTIGTKLTGFVG